ncbi:hypothetical protein FO519_001571 [Halicephalobus sp. NKZ332]|nr:hypothetical protein FO519_001571 [Halicephalobus sp. NKZ332]
MEASKHCVFPGWILEITTMLAYYLNVTIEPIVGSTAEFGGGVGNLINCSWNGLLGAIYNDTVDTVASMYQYTSEREAYFQFSYPVYNIQVVYISRTKSRSVASYLWNATLPYSTTVWFILVASWFSQTLAGVIIRKAEHRMELIRHYDPFEKIWQYLRLQIHQGEDRKRPFKSVTGHMAFAFFALLQATMFSLLYQASLLASLLQPADLLPFHSAEEMVKLINSREYQLLATTDNYKSSWYFTDLAHSNDLHFRTLREALVNNPIVLADSVDSALKMISDGNYIYPAQQDSFSLIKMREHCNLFKFSEGLPQKSAYYLFNKASNWTKLWNQGILMNQAFIQRTFRKYFEEDFLLGNVTVCPITKDEIPESQKPLDIVAVFGIFIMYFVGLSIAGAAFGCEIWFFHHAKKLITKHFSKVTLKIQRKTNTREEQHDFGKDHDANNDISMVPTWSGKVNDKVPVKLRGIKHKTNKKIALTTGSFQAELT